MQGCTRRSSRCAVPRSTARSHRRTRPAPRRTVPGLSRTSTSPEAIKYMQSPGSPRRMMTAARRVVARPQQARDVGDDRGADVVEERHLGDEVPGAQKLAPPQLLGIAGRENAGPQRENQDAGNHDDPGQNPPERGYRRHIAVAGRCQGYDRPPQRRAGSSRTARAARRARADRRGWRRREARSRNRAAPRAVRGGRG